MNPLEFAMRALRRAKFLLRKGNAEQEMNEEMRIHLEFEIDDRVKRGVPPADARRSALVDFGGVERFKEDARVARGVRPVEDLVQDAKYAFRVLRKSPGFTVASVLTAAIGIAVTTAAFSALNAVLLRPPPVREPDRLVTVAEVWKNGMRSFQTDMAQFMYPYAHMLELRNASNSALSGMGGYRYGNVAVRNGNEARPLSSMAVSLNFFTVLGLRPALGRLFTDTTEHSGQPPAELVIGHEFWQREFAGDSSVIGRTLFVDGRALDVVGVAPKGFHGTMIGLAADVWLPTNSGTVTMFGRLRTGVSAPQAVSALTTAAREFPASEPARKIVRITLDAMTGPPAMSRGAVIGFMGMLMFMSVLVLLIVATNIAGMFLARAAFRRREIAVRLSLGASRARIVRQLLTESIALSLLGGALGVWLAHMMLNALVAVEIPVPYKVVMDFGIDRTVLLTAFAITLFTGIIAGLAPALQSAKLDLLSGLRATVGTLPGKSGRSRNVFVVTQLSVSLVLLVTAGLFTRALYRATHTDQGLNTANVMVAKVMLPSRDYDKERGRAFFERLATQLAARPEISMSALAEWTPLAFGRNSEDVRRPDGGGESVTYGVADANYTETMHIPLVAGRMFNDTDTPQSALVAVVNETLAKRIWPGRNPLGQILALNGNREVVGVVRDGKYRSLDEAPIAYAFLPVSQRYSSHLTIHARARSDRAAALRAIREEVALLDPNIALQGAGALSDEMGMHMMPQRFAAWCIGVFGLFGLGLAALGIYGVVAYQVVQRTREFGIRLALGAHGRDIVRSVLRPALRIVAVGAVISAPLAIAVARLARGYLYGVGANDPVTLASVLALFGVVILAASYIPARRAARVDPMVSLRAE